MSATLIPAKELVAKNKSNFPGESAEYRAARNALLAEEIELRRQIERVAELRRQLPMGGQVKDYHFVGENGAVTLSGLFGGRHTLILYSYMFGPKRQRPCPMCTSQISAWSGEGKDIVQRVAFAIVARSPIERLIAFKKERGWHDVALYSDASGDYTRDYVSADDADIPALNVFEKRDGAIRHFWGGEMSDEMSDPGQDPRGAPDTMPIWTLLDLTREGRGKDWYPKLEY